MPVVERLARPLLPSSRGPPGDLRTKCFIFNNLTQTLICKIFILKGLCIKPSFLKGSVANGKSPEYRGFISNSIVVE
jgi:hypothetical protein